MDTLPLINHIFVDFENVHEVDLSLIGQKSVHVTVLVGPKQTKLDAELVEKILRHADSVHLVRLLEPGHNAVDFALAYYVGRAAVLDPSGYFHVISGDTGYDPLISHLRRNHVRAHRHPDFAALKETLNPTIATAPAAGAAPTLAAALKPAPVDKTVPASVPKVAPLHERAGQVLNHLRSHAKNRPAKETTLAHHIPSILGKGATEDDARQVIKSLRSSKKISINDKGRVTYHL